jgi:hypothetical protein
VQQLDGLIGLPPLHLAVVVGSSPPIELVPDPGGVSAARLTRSVWRSCVGAVSGAPLRASLRQAVADRAGLDDLAGRLTFSQAELMATGRALHSQESICW